MEGAKAFLLIRNTPGDWFAFFLILCLGIFSLIIFYKIVLKRLKAVVSKTENKVDDFLVAFIDRNVIILYFFFLIFLIAINQINVQKSVVSLLTHANTIFLTYLIADAIIGVFGLLLESSLLKRNIRNSGTKGYEGFLSLFKIIIWFFVIIFLLDNFGVKISAVMAGLGVGGVALALASQTFLGDLFNYFAIIFDRPFEVGDFIVADSIAGAVESIGIKSTKVRSINGELLIVSNSDLTKKIVQNYKRMESRRVLFKIGVIYATPAEKLEEIPTLIRDIIGGILSTKFDRCHFASYGDFSLIFETVYYVLTNDYNVYMDIQQQINLGIAKMFNQKGIMFAFPTSTVNLVVQKGG
ncbi:MAG: mechanosensitive ion channel family protein [Oligoflexia bacterium]|nr:mechanosensitive ion channel family protein [Oligoflexia bacterium]